MAVSLVIMAAGLGSRYGGSKQVDGIGPNGEILMEYSIHDALRAGFDKVVFIIKPEMREMMDELVGYLKEKKTAKGQPVQVAYVYQDYTSVPDFYHIPEGRTKPFGTVHALLCAEPEVDGPFCVINADDYYGVDAYRTIYEELVKLPAEGKGTMVGYLLKNTASLHGTVSRGVCKVKDGKLDTIQEALKVQLYPDGHLTDLDTDTDLAPDTVVSMNLWGFTRSFLAETGARFAAFLDNALKTNPLKGEYFLPSVVSQLIAEDKAQVKVLHSRDKWYGVTYKEDKPVVVAAIAEKTAQGLYPDNLWEV